MSCSKDTEIIINTGSKINPIYKGTISIFIDKLLKDNKDSVKYISEDSVVLDIHDNYKIVGVSNTEKTSWNNILQVSRHPANGKLVKVTTRSGRTTVATMSHSFLKRTVDSITTIKGSDLKVGDRIPIAKNIPVINNPINKVFMDGFEVKLTNDFGWFCGAYIAEGRIDKATISITNISDVFIERIKNIALIFDKNASIYKYTGEYGPGTTTSFGKIELAKWLRDNFGVESFNKKIAGLIYGANLDFIKGLLRGYFDGDGNINAMEGKQMIRCGSRSEELIDGINVLLTYCGIYGTKAKDSLSLDDKILYTIQISRKYAKQYKDMIGTNMNNKMEALEHIINYNNRINKKSEIERIDRIPELGHIIADTGNLLKMEGQSRIYGRWKNKEAIGRNTLVKYINEFEKYTNKDITNIDKIIGNIEILKQAAYSNVIWDEIIQLDILDDPKEYVYDFTVPGNDTFMVDHGVLLHNTLNTFHSAGIGGMGTTTLGVTRMKEIMNFSKNMKTPVMTIYLEENVRENKAMADKIAGQLKYTPLAEIRDRVDIYYNPNPFAKGGFMERDNVMNPFYKYNATKYSCQSDISNLPWLMRIVLNKNDMMEKNITLLDIKAPLCNKWERRFLEVKGMRREEKQLLEKITSLAILSNNENDKIPILHLRFDMKDFNLSTVKSFLDNFVEPFKLKGINNIHNIRSINPERMLDFNNKNREVIEGKQYVIYTDGVNLESIRYIKGVDVNKTICNDLVAIYNKLGIEAARTAILYEINNVFEKGGNDVNYQHLSVLSDVMTHTGILIPIDRHGMKKLDNDPLAKASFEQMVDHLITAAVFNQKDHMNSVSSRIMAGLAIKGGTGLCEVILDTETLEKSEYIEDLEQKYEKTFTNLETNIVMDDIIGQETIGIFIPE